MIAYHAVTERPMHAGQQIIFDAAHRSGVYQRVHSKIDIVKAIYADPASYHSNTLEHHTAVALRELALEEVRMQKYPMYPSRLSCLYVSKTLEEAERWADFFARLGRPTYHIVKLAVEGHCFIGDAAKCFRGQTDHQENLRLADLYWANKADPADQSAVPEMLVDGRITVLEIVREINANLNA